MVEFLQFDETFWQPVLFTVSLLALFRELGVTIPAGQGGCPGARPAITGPLFPPVSMCCFEVTKTNAGLRRGFIQKDDCRTGEGGAARGECSGMPSCCKMCKHLTAQKEEAFDRKGRAWLERTACWDHLCAQPFRGVAV